MSSAPSNVLSQIRCGGYVFYTSDGSTFQRTDVEPVSMTVTQSGHASTLHSQITRKRTYPLDENVECKTTDNEDDSEGEELIRNFHICNTDVRPSDNFQIGDGCSSWSTLSSSQQAALIEIRDRVDYDRTKNAPFTCAIVEGPGGCGKTRLMSHIMNHSNIHTLVLYVTKQNKRVQDFIHTDCLDGESDPTIQQPLDLTNKSAHDIRELVQNRNNVGRYALTAEKLVFAISGLRPNAFNRSATVSSLGMNNYNLMREGQDNTEHAPAERNIVVLMDEYTMLQPPLIHAIAFYLRAASMCPQVLLMGGDRKQCGPVGWNDSEDNDHSDPLQHYGVDVRGEIIAKLAYQPLDIQLESLKRCEGDAALGACVKRLRRVCSYKQTRVNKQLINLILAKYSVESGVNLFRKEIDESGSSVIRRVIPADDDILDFRGPNVRFEGSNFEALMSLVDEEDLDARGVEFLVAQDSPSFPAYDLLSLVQHYTDLFVKLAETGFTDSDQTWPPIINESVHAVKDLFPVLIVLTNTLCNVFAETFLLALSTKVKECVSRAPIPPTLAVTKLSQQEWYERLQITLRRCIRSLVIDEDNAIQRQTLFLGVIYKMTSTIKTNENCSLCNGERVLLTYIAFDDDTSLDRLNSVTLRKLERDSGRDLVLRTGHNENRMSNAKRMCIMPFVPYVSENIYQMQGNTIPETANTFVDLANAPSSSVYVAVSRFKISSSIKGIVITT